MHLVRLGKNTPLYLYPQHVYPQHGPSLKIHVHVISHLYNATILGLECLRKLNHTRSGQLHVNKLLVYCLAGLLSAYAQKCQTGSKVSPGLIGICFHQKWTFDHVFYLKQFAYIKVQMCSSKISQNNFTKYAEKYIFVLI